MTPIGNAGLRRPEKAATKWLEARPISGQAPGDFTPFGHTLDAKGMNYLLGDDAVAHVSLYSNGHWLRALSALYAVQPKSEYRERAAALVSFYCGNNDVHARLYNELGAVYNRITDRDGDGCFEGLRWNAYPESTAFFQIGLIHYLRFVHGHR